MLQAIAPAGDYTLVYLFFPSRGDTIVEAGEAHACVWRKDRAMSIKAFRALLALAFVALSLVSFGARAQEVVIVTGEHWTKSGNDLKKAYLLGIANILQVELAYLGSNQVPDQQNFAPRMARGLKGETVDSVTRKIDAWYAANPSMLSRPVIDVLWVEVVTPGLKQS